MNKDISADEILSLFATIGMKVTTPDTFREGGAKDKINNLSTRQRRDIYKVLEEALLLFEWAEK